MLSSVNECEIFFEKKSGPIDVSASVNVIDKECIKDQFRQKELPISPFPFFSPLFFYNGKEGVLISRPRGPMKRCLPHTSKATEML